jgi:outer membrane protein insertion porin family
MRIFAWVVAATIALVAAAPRPALAIGEVITDVRVRENARTEEDTIRSIAGISIGETMELHTLEVVRERLNTCGLFADVNVYWEPYKDGVRVNIVIQDKIPWAPLPTFSYSPGNISGGLFIGHGNLFGRGKRGIIGGRVSTADSGALLAYQDPALFGSWVFYEFTGRFQDQTIPEFSNVLGTPLTPVRETSLRSLGFSGGLGVAWFRVVKTSVGWTIDNFKLRGYRVHDAPDEFPGATGLPAGAAPGVRANITTSLTFDFRAREHAIMWGNALSFGFDHGGSRWGGDRKFNYMKVRASYEQGFRFFRRHNLILRVGGYAGRDLPLWSENSVGGTDLRGYVYHQFAGDTQFNSQVEYHFPLFSISKLDVRGVVFQDAAAIWYRDLPPTDQSGTTYDVRPDGRSFLPTQYLREGFDRNRDVHTSAGGGLRFYLRSIAVPLVGVDGGYGISGHGPWRIVLIIGL